MGASQNIIINGSVRKGEGGGGRQGGSTPYSLKNAGVLSKEEKNKFIIETLSPPSFQLVARMYYLKTFYNKNF